MTATHAKVKSSSSRRVTSAISSTAARRNSRPRTSNDFDHILELERQKRNQSFDEEICREQALDLLDLSALKARFSALGKPLDEEKLKNIKLIQLEQGTLYPTQGLMILLGQYPHVVTKCARFKGTDMSVFLDRKEYSGDLFTQLEQAEAFIKNHINLRGEIKGLQRTDTFEIPEAALREALINAVIHRDYTNQGRDIKVGVYDDIVNIVSPGGFPNTLTAEALTEGRSEIRNRVVARVFKELGYIEQWGSGIQRIKKTCTDHGLAEPRIREKGDFVDVEFYRPVADSIGLPADSDRICPIAPEYVRLADEITSDSIGRVSDSIGRVSEKQRRILEYMQEQQTITSKTVESLVAVKEAMARRILKKMNEKGLIVRKGQGRSTYYVLMKAKQGEGDA
ncbi:MAG: ATP-dependent DNA helicase [Desulfuromonadales bacterium]|nr:ATP-dependent DNA helicase [Desulfuromonadales bacterium]